MTAEIEAMRTISWFTCDCPWTTKYCEEEHRAYARVPLVALELMRSGASRPEVGRSPGYDINDLRDAWLLGVNAQWKHRPIGNRIPETSSPYRSDS